MQRPLSLLALVLLLALPLGAQSFHGRVNRAIDAGVASLKKRQNKDGSFGGKDENHPIGRTVLSLLAMVHAGLDASDPEVKRGLEWLGFREGYTPETLRHKSVYETGILMLLLHAMGKGKHKATLRRLGRWMVDNFDDRAGYWGYPWPQVDLSNTQYAVMGLRVAEEQGFVVPRRVWKKLTQRVLSLQGEDGGFRYRPDTVVSGSMTHAGMISLLFAKESRSGGFAPAKVNAALRKGHRFCVKRFSVTHNPHGEGYHRGHYHYYMYGLERYAVFFGLDRIGKHDWYREGAEELLRSQGKDGAWGALPETSFAILFLRKAGLSTTPRKKGAGQGAPIAKNDSKPKGPQRPKEKIPFLRRWLIAGPFPVKKRDDSMLRTAFLPEKRLIGYAGQRAGKSRWVRHEAEKDRVDLHQATEAKDHAAWYAFAWVHSEVEQKVVLWIGSDDGNRVYLNGALLREDHHHDGTGTDHEGTPMTLKKGPNRLLLKIENLGYGCNFIARFATPEGKAVPGLAVSLSKKSPR